MSNLLSNLITSALWTLAIAAVVTDRLLWPFVRSIFVALTEDTTVAAIAPATPVAPVTLAKTAAIKSPRARRGKHAFAVTA